MERRGITMRNLLHFGLFALALTAVTQASAQDTRRGDRHTTVVIAPGGAPRSVRPVRASFEPPRAVYDSRRTFPVSSRATHDARRAYLDQQQDLQQIVAIAKRWEWATASRDRHAQWKVDQRLDAWLTREIRESAREPHNHRYAYRVRALNEELAMLERRVHDRPARYGHGARRQGHHWQGRQGYYAKKARILDELVELSERQLERARASVRYPMRPSFAYR
jgi:hypothetical protein